MGKQATCHTCVYAWWEPGLWMRTLWSGFPARPVCGNRPDSYGRMKECPRTGICRNYRARPPVPTGENVKRIPLGNECYAYVDPEDYERLSRFHWRAYSAGYAARWENGKLIYMHREIMKPPKGKIVDHINGNGYDNTRANLRNISRRQNMYNKGKHVGTASIYKGVVRDRRTGKWFGQIRSGDARPASPLFDDEADAARAYDYMAVGVFGEFAGLNFPEEWSAERRAQVHAQWQKDHRKTRGRKKVQSKKSRKVATRTKTRTRTRRKTKAGR